MRRDCAYVAGWCRTCITPVGSGAEDPPAVRGDAVAAAERLPSDFELLSLGFELVRTLWGAHAAQTIDVTI